jgi:hypothetical protein
MIGPYRKCFWRKPNGRRKAGRQKLKRLYCIENDLKPTGVKRRRKKAENKPIWAVILKEVLVNP